MRLNRFSKVSIIYQMNVVAFIISYVVTLTHESYAALYWALYLAVAAIVNSGLGLVTLITAYFLADKTKALHQAQCYFISLSLILIIGVPICFLQLNMPQIR